MCVVEGHVSRIEAGRESGFEEVMLTGEVKLTDFGAASPTIPLSKEDERSAALAARAQKGDYDDGNSHCSKHNHTTS